MDFASKIDEDGVFPGICVVSFSSGDGSGSSPVLVGEGALSFQGPFSWKSQW